MATNDYDPSFPTEDEDCTFVSETKNSTSKGKVSTNRSSVSIKRRPHPSNSGSVNTLNIRWVSSKKSSTIQTDDIPLPISVPISPKGETPLPPNPVNNSAILEEGTPNIPFPAAVPPPCGSKFLSGYEGLKSKYDAAPLPVTIQPPSGRDNNPPSKSITLKQPAETIPLPSEEIPLPRESSKQNFERRESQYKPSDIPLPSNDTNAPTGIPMPATPAPTLAEPPKPEDAVSPTLSKIQMLIKQKAEKLKESPSTSSEPKLKTSPLTIGIGKSRSNPAEKVKFAVIKRDVKVSMFAQDDDEETKPQTSLPKLSPSKIKLSVGPHKPVIDKAVVERIAAKKQELEMKLRTPSKGSDKIGESSTGAGRRVRKVSELEDLKANMLTISKEADTNETNENEKMKCTPNELSTDSALPMKYKSDSVVSSTATPLTSQPKNTMVASTASILPKSVRSSKQSYEADSTIPDELTPNKTENHTLTLYSDSDEDINDSKQSPTKSQSPKQHDTEAAILISRWYRGAEETVDPPDITSSSNVVSTRGIDETAVPASLDPIIYPILGAVPTPQSASVDRNSADSSKSLVAKTDDSQKASESEPKPVPPPMGADEITATADVSELTAVAQQLYQALSERIAPALEPGEVKDEPKLEKSRAREKSTSRNRSASRGKSSSRGKRSKRSRSRDRRSRSRGRRSRSRGRRSRSRGRRSSSRTKSSYRSSKRRNRSSSRGRRDRDYRSRSRDRRSRSRDKETSSSRSRNRRTRTSRSPDDKKHDKERSDSSTSASRSTPAPTSSITNKLIAENLALVSSTQPVPVVPPATETTNTVVQYVYSTDGQLKPAVASSSFAPSTWTELKEGPPPPPPGMGPPLPSTVPGPPPPPPVVAGAPPPPSVGAPPPPPPPSGFAPPTAAAVPVSFQSAQVAVGMPPPPPGMPIPQQPLDSTYYNMVPNHDPTWQQQPGLGQAWTDPSYHDTQWGQPRPVYHPPPLMSTRPMAPERWPAPPRPTMPYAPRSRGPPPPPPGFRSFGPRPRPVVRSRNIRPLIPPSQLASHLYQQPLETSFEEPPKPERAVTPQSDRAVTPQPERAITPQPDDDMDIIASPTDAEGMDISPDSSFTQLATEPSAALPVEEEKKTLEETVQPVVEEPKKPKRKSRFDEPPAMSAVSSGMKMMPVLSITPLPSILTESLNKQDNTESTGDSKPEDSGDEPTSRRRSSRIQSKESRAQAESKIKEEKEKQESERRRLSESVAQAPKEEEVVDFVIESRSPRKSIDLPDRSEVTYTSPSKTPPTSSTCAPGKLKMRWLQKQQQENVAPVIVSQSAQMDITTGSEKLEISQAEKTAEAISHPLTAPITNHTVVEPQAIQKIKEPAQFDRIDDNMYLTSSKKNNKSQKEAKRMVCDCSTSEEDRSSGFIACGDDCLNRMLMIECGSRCPCGEYCTNKRFQRHLNAKVDIFLTENKGHGLRAEESLPKGSFIREYVGEVLGAKEFKHRVKQYARDQHRHYYFMALNTDEIIDATQKGNISRFINHSCDPNAETQKWTVNGKLRIGFFTTRDVHRDEEITFDYQFERYGKEAQVCYCGSDNCRGFIGGEKTTQPFKVVDYKPAGTSKKKKEDKKKDYDFSGDMLSFEIEKLYNLGGLKRSEHVLQLSRLMVRAESIEHRMQLVDTVLETTNENCLRLFLSYHGLSLLWSWMVDLPSAGSNDLKLLIISLLKRLPITNKNIIQETKVLSAVERLDEQTKERLSDLAKELKLKQEELEELVNSRLQQEALAETKLTETKQLGTKPGSDSDDGSGDVSNKHETIPPDDNVQTPAHDECSMRSENVDEDGNVTQNVGEAPPPPSPPGEAELTELEIGNVSQTQPGTENVTQIVKETLSQLTEQISSAELHQSDDTNLQTDYVSTKADNMSTKAEEIGVPPSDGTTPQDESSENNNAMQTDAMSTHSSKISAPCIDLTVTADEDSQDDCMSQDELSQDAAPPVQKPEDRLREEIEKIETEIEDLKHMLVLIAELLENWSLLKESFKIPKKEENEERKRTVHEIDTSKQEDTPARTDKHARDRNKDYHSKYSKYGSKKRKRDYSPDTRAQKRREQNEMVRSHMEKMERRRMFEEQVRAEEEEQAAYEQQQFEEYQRQYYHEQAVEQQQQAADQFSAALYPTQAAYIPPQVTPQSSAFPAQTYAAQSSQPYTAQALPVQQLAGFIQPTSVQQSVAAAPLVQSSVPLTTQAQTVCYYTTPQGVLVQQIVQAAPAQPQNPAVIYMTSAAGADNPPPPPDDSAILPTDWRSAKDPQGRTYYYHRLTRQTQWEIPTSDDPVGGVNADTTPPTTHSKKNKGKHKKTTMAPADTSADAKKIKEHFKSAISVHIRTLLNGYMKPDCKTGKITNKDDYKFLAKKLTHAVLDKEMKHCRHHEDLEVNENVKFKAKEFVKKYMAKSGSVYKREKDDKGSRS